MNIEWGKLGLLGFTLVGCFGCLAFGAVAPELIVPIITAIIGYVAGNGRLASKGEMSVPMFSPSLDTQLEVLAAKVSDRLDREA